MRDFFLILLFISVFIFLWKIGERIKEKIDYSYRRIKLYDAIVYQYDDRGGIEMQLNIKFFEKHPKIDRGKGEGIDGIIYGAGKKFFVRSNFAYFYPNYLVFKGNIIASSTDNEYFKGSELFYYKKLKKLYSEKFDYFKKGENLVKGNKFEYYIGGKWKDRGKIWGNVKGIFYLNF